MNKKSLFVWIPLISAVAFICGMWAEFFLSREPEMSYGQKKLNSILNTIREQYVDEIDADSL